MKKESAYERLKRGNRKQRKDLQRQLYAENPGLEVVHPNAAGIDIGNESHFVAVPPGRDAEPVREFGSWTADVERLAAWLKVCAIDTVAMQSTGVYWFAVYDVLEKHGLQVFLVNARHTKNLPGRKSDVQESQWLMKLHTYGLLRNSFRPPEEIRPIRAVWGRGGYGRVRVIAPLLCAIAKHMDTTSARGSRARMAVRCLFLTPEKSESL